MRSIAAGALALVCLLAAAGIMAQSAAPVALSAGKNYREIPQQPIADASRVEVIDFFFYGCPFCNELRPMLERWRKGLSADVVFRRVPTVRHDSWAPLARTYFTLDALGESERLHEEVYKSYHDEELHMSKPDVMADWASRQGIERQRWLEVYNSQDVSRRVEHARKLTRDYDIQGTPSIVVNGRYLTSSGLTDDVKLVVPVVQLLVDRERARK
ncbi:MAG: thiol:disulfide interchange protein DsbA/DsbL [Betaproteobacteria bacterium]|nr:MAG: thiol:disulfide interchange protein DsbA/DsbL [Betaproteobacteria bacterium]